MSRRRGGHVIEKALKYNMASFERGRDGKIKTEKRVVRAWTKADVKILRSIGKDQLSTKQAAKQLGRTVRALYQKAMLLGISFRAAKRKRRQAA